MKKLVLAAALTGFASFASAGGMSEPMMEPEIVIETVEETGGSSNALIIPLILIALIAAATA
ncbi:MAG: hypothetical protein AAFP13_07450 [Pseudomonadota bacterium]